jgi:hypothetical protein
VEDGIGGGKRSSTDSRTLVPKLTFEYVSFFTFGGDDVDGVRFSSCVGAGVGFERVQDEVQEGLL